MNQATLQEILHYNPETGMFTWKKDRGPKAFAGTRAGCIDSLGYRAIRLDKLYKAHRLAFLWMTGEIPKEVDHINRIRCDNRWENLRAVTRSENQKNRPLSRNNTSGFHGIYKEARSGNWVAQIKNNRENVYLGSFKELSDAVKARLDAEEALGFHPNHGKVYA